MTPEVSKPPQYVDLAKIDRSLFTPQFDPNKLQERLKQQKIDTGRITHLGGARQVEAYLAYQKKSELDEDGKTVEKEGRVVIRIYKKEDSPELQALNKRQKETLLQFEELLKIPPNPADEEDFPYDAGVPHFVAGVPGCVVETYVDGQHIQDIKEKNIAPVGNWKQIFMMWHQIYQLFNHLNTQGYAWVDFQPESIKLDPTTLTGGLVDACLIQKDEPDFNKTQQKNSLLLLGSLGMAIGGKKEGIFADGLQQLPLGLHNMMSTLSLEPSLLYTKEITNVLKKFANLASVTSPDEEGGFNRFLIRHLVDNDLKECSDEFEHTGFTMDTYKLWYMHDIVEELDLLRTTKPDVFYNKIEGTIDKIHGAHTLEHLKGQLMNISDRPAQYHRVYTNLIYGKNGDKALEELKVLPPSPESIRLQLLHSNPSDRVLQEKFGKKLIAQILEKHDLSHKITKSQAIESITVLGQEHSYISDIANQIALQLQFEVAYDGKKYHDAINIFPKLSPDMRRVADIYYTKGRYNHSTVVEQLEDLQNHQDTELRRGDLQNSYSRLASDYQAGSMSGGTYTTRLSELSFTDPIGVFELIQDEFLTLNFKDPIEGDSVLP